MTPLRVLSIDCDHQIGQFLRVILEASHCSVQTKRSVAVLEEPGLAFDILILDLGGPSGNEAGVHELFRHVWPDRPVLCTCGAGIPSCFETYRHQPQAAFLSKPFTQAEVLAKLESLLPRQFWGPA
jgi:DNA-binding response OmpR family regulator